jgi:hAT family C-terminal dimerisation region
MSAEVERLFSSAKLMISAHRSCLEPQSIEAGECIRSWVGAKLFYGDYFDYLSYDGRLQEHFRLQSTAPFG